MFANSFTLKRKVLIFPILVLLFLAILPALSFAASAEVLNTMDLTDSWFGYIAVFFFF